MQENNRINEEIEIDLKDLLGVLIQRAWIIILSSVVVAVAAFIVSAFMMTPKYESTTSIYILTKANSSNLTYSDTQLASQLTKDYPKLIKSRSVLEKVMEECGVDESYGHFSDRVSVANSTDTRIIYITVKDTDPVVAQILADEIREVAAERIQAVTDVTAVNVVDAANFPTAQCEPNVQKNTILGFLIGFVLAAGVIIVIYLLDDTIKTSEDVEKYLGLSTLAVIPDHDPGDGSVITKKKTLFGKKKASSSSSRRHHSQTEKESEENGVKEA